MQEDTGAAFDGAGDWVSRYEAGLAAWRARDFTAAIGSFEKVLEIRKNDVASVLMIERCRHQIENPSADDWDGTSIARTK